ncbi:MAG TPA: AsmA family protein [Vicinamibacteria bacterium]|nr:AsmA family protein [Vicinamibacteria bacterium]
MSRKALLIAASVLAALLLALLLLAFLALRRVDTPGFRKALLERAKATLGAEVRLQEMEVSVLSGIRVRGVAIANPAPFKGDIVTADEFVFRYRLLPLLYGRFEVNRLSLRAPVVALAMDAAGRFNYERLGARSASAPTSRPTALPLRVSISRLAMDSGRITVTDAARASLLAIEGLDFDSSFDVGPEGASGRGEARIARLGLASGVAATSLRAPLEIAKGAARVAPFTADLAGGSVKGALVVRFADARMGADLELDGVEVKRLAEEAKASSGIVGRLKAKATVEGTGGVETLKGKGHAEVQSCRVEQSKLFALLATALRLPELLHPELSECRVEFTLGGGRVTTPIVRMIGPAVQLDGKGALALRSGALDYDMNLALATAVVERIPAKELRAAFKERGDGFGSLAFRVTGTTESPQTDLVTRLATAAAGEAAKGKVRKLLEKLF